MRALLLTSYTAGLICLAYLLCFTVTTVGGAGPLALIAAGPTFGYLLKGRKA